MPEIDFSKFLVAVARQGDTILIGYRDYMEDELLTDIEAFFAEALPGIRVHFTDNVQSMIVIKGGGDV